MPHTLGPYSLSQLLDETFNIYRRNFMLFIGISLVPNLILLLLQLVLTGPPLEIEQSGTMVIALGGLISFVASLFAASIVTAATTFGVSDLYLDRPTSMAECYSRVANKALKVIYVSFVVDLTVAFGTLLCIVPGIYWAGSYGVAVPAAVLEDTPATECMNRSSSLTSDSVGRVIVIYLLTGIFIACMAATLEGVALVLTTRVFHASTTFAPHALRQITTALSSILFGPVSAIALTLVYYDQRVRKEAFDIEHMMSLMAAASSAPAGNR